MSNLKAQGAAGVVGATASLAVPSFGGIATVNSLRDHLQCAIELEHSTLPPYLCALYSLDAARNPAATEVLISVLMEEMLHLTLAANMLNAVGGRPQLDIPEMMPGYPRGLPHGDPSCEMSLLPFGAEAVQQFLRVERPAPVGAPSQCDQYETIGQFYDAIRQALVDLCDDFGEAAVFCGDPSRQVTSSLSYGGSGRIVAVDSLATALEALGEIVEQGEGASNVDVWDGDRDMFHADLEQVGHFYRIQQLVAGQRYRRGDTPLSGPSGDAVEIDHDGVAPMQHNPRLSDHPAGHPVRIAQETFNRTYRRLLSMLDQAFNGQPQTLGQAVGVMYELKSQALALMTMPTGDGLTTAGPTFEYRLPEDRV